MRLTRPTLRRDPRDPAPRNTIGTKLVHARDEARRARDEARWACT
jgi:hypothetical protein